MNGSMNKGRENKELHLNSNVPEYNLYLHPQLGGRQMVGVILRDYRVQRSMKGGTTIPFSLTEGTETSSVDCSDRRVRYASD